MNYWLSATWLLACVLLGFGVYHQFANRVRDLTGWVNFCDHLHQSIGFVLQPLPQVVAAYLPVARGNCAQVLQRYLQMLNAKSDLTRANCRTLLHDETLSEFLYQLGRTGRETEQNKISAVRAVLQERLSTAKQDLRTKASITLKLLIIIGIAGGILWI